MPRHSIYKHLAEFHAGAADLAERLRLPEPSAHSRPSDVDTPKPGETSIGQRSKALIGRRLMSQFTSVSKDQQEFRLFTSLQPKLGIESETLINRDDEGTHHHESTALTVSQSHIEQDTASAIESLSIKSENNQDDTCDKQLENQQFDVVLVDIKKATNREVFCVKRNLFDVELRYVAISYRWGELTTKIIPIKREETDEDTYAAHITSFDMDDFYKLCQYIMDEDDLKTINYLFIDCICIDQTDQKKRKATIRRMPTIYERATYILAVPDLHLGYLKVNPSNRYLIDLIEKHRPYIYHRLAENRVACEEIDHIWFLNHLCDPTLKPEQLLIFFSQQLRLILTTCKGGIFCDNQFSLAMLEMSPLFFVRGRCLTRSLRGETRASVWARKYIEKYPCIRQNLNTDILPEIERLEQEERKQTSSASNEKWLNHPWCNNMKTILESWEREWDKIQTEREQADHFLTSLMKDWLNRAWAISASLIAKKRYEEQQIPMKVVFLFLGMFPNDDGRSTFISAFNERDNRDFYNPAYRGNRVPKLVKNVHEQHYLGMILGSKATRNEDRFYAILPLWPKYSRHIRNDDTISSWKLTDIVSIHLKLYQLMDDVIDKVILLKLLAENVNGSVPTLPSFASNYNAHNMVRLKRILRPQRPTPHCPISSIDLLPPGYSRDNSDDCTLGLYRLRVCTNGYFPVDRGRDWDCFIPSFYQNQQGLYKHLQLERDYLAIVLIPIGRPAKEHFYICLIGDKRKNRWISINGFNARSTSIDVTKCASYYYEETKCFYVY